MGLLGCHVSIAGGVQNAPEHGLTLGCESIQIFTRNQQRWASKPLEKEQICGFKKGFTDSGIQAVIVHSIYLINLASPDRALRRKSEVAFLDEMDRCEALGVPYLVFHPGSARESSKRRGMTRLCNCLRRFLHIREESNVNLLIENTAGAGNILGASFEEIGEIRDRVGIPHRLQVCFDTAHAFAAGYDLQTEASFHEIMDEFDSQIGLEFLRAFHLNDTAAELGSHRDRHENIGQGLIGEETFRCLVNDKRFKNHPMTLETPGGREWFRRNLELLFSFRQDK